MLTLQRSSFRRMLVMLAGLIVCLAGFSWLLSAQDPTPPGFRAYSLNYARAVDVAPQLQTMLDESGTRQEVLAERSGNRLLVRGPDEALRLADQLVRTLDRPANSPASPAPARSAAVARGYPAGPGSIDATLQKIRTRFPASSGVRAAADPRTGQVIVVASEDLHRQVAELLQTAPAAAPSAVNKTAAAPLAARPAGNQPSTQPAAPVAARNGHRLTHITWRELEDELTRLLGTRLQRSTSENGEIATLHTGDNQAAPVLQIDRRNNWVSFLGAAATAEAWQRVIEAFDQPREADSRTQLMSISNADPRQVQAAVALIQEASQRPAAGQHDTVAMILQPPVGGEAPVAAAPAEPAAPAGQEPGPEGETPLDDGGLIGPVQIEYLPGLDVIVLRGNKRDVERVQRIIADIERLSQETQPDIDVHRLRFVGSQVMAEMVTAIYNEILSPRQGVVTIRPLVKPNALLLIGRKESVKVVKDLIDRLDQPVPPESQFQVFPLKHISALDAQQTITDFFVDRLGATQPGVAAQQGARPPLGTRVNVVADYRTNSLIVHASPRDMAELRSLIASLDIESAASTNELRIFRLRNTLATDIAPVLQDALNWQLIGNRSPLGATPAFGAVGIGQAEERTRIRTAILTFMTIDSEGGRLLESGLLSDVRVTADANGNSLIITGPAKSMGLIEALIRELDRLPSAQAQIKVFTIINGDAATLAGMLQQLLSQAATTAAGGLGTLFGQGTLNPFLTPGLQSAAATGEGSLVPVRFGVDQRTNSIIVSGSEGDLGVIEAILLRLDEESLRTQRTVVYWVANAPAAEVAAAVNTWLQQRTQFFAQQLQVSPESPEIRFAREAIVVAETISNSIIISASPTLLPEVMQVVESLDRRPPMIKIDVLIAEVALNDVFEFGAEFGLQDSLLFDRTYLPGNPLGSSPNSAWGGRPGLNFNNKPLGDITTGDPGNLLGQGLSNFNLGRISPTQGYGGLVLSASSDAVSMLLRALQERGRAQILSRPTITTLDSQPASVNVGAITARPGDISQTVNATTQGIREVQVGLVLGVTPRVTPDGLIVMEVDAERSRLDESNAVVINGNVIQNIRNAQASTTISARSGQTVVFAGLIETDESKVVRGIPFLSDLPWVGPLFSFTQNRETRSELLIILTPRIIFGNDAEIDAIRCAETERMSWCLADVIDLYGNVGSMAARNGPWCPAPDPAVIFPHENPGGFEAVPTPADRAIPTPADPPEQLFLPPLRPSASLPAGEPGALESAGGWSPPNPISGPEAGPENSAPYSLAPWAVAAPTYSVAPASYPAAEAPRVAPANYVP